MVKDIDPRTLAEISDALDESYDAVLSLCQAVPEPLFLERPEGKWSIGQNLDHLVRSSMGLASSLSRPKSFFAQFGSPGESMRNFGSIRDDYYRSFGLRIAPPNLAPDEAAPQKPRAELTESWLLIRGKFRERLAAHWTEEELNLHCLPHPAFGRLTMREILLFTIFHNYHHLAAMRRIAGRP